MRARLMTTETQGTARKPWIAVVLSLFCTGLGHIYSGRIVTGLILFLVSLLFAPVAVLVAYLGSSTTILIGLVMAALAVVAVYLFAVVDAFRAALKAGDGFRLRDYNRGIIYLLFVVVGVMYPVGVAQYLRANVFEAFLIPTASEAPNFLPGDHVLVNKTMYQLRAPERGDVIVFRSPKERRLNWIKRVIALPGDTVEVKGTDVIVNGKKLERDRVSPSTLPFALEEGSEAFYEISAGRRYRILLAPTDEKPVDFPEQTVPKGYCFVLGDNRNRSMDSRGVGLIPLAEVIGAVQYIYWPAETWTRFGACPD
jgi:signal peptidase I